MKLSSSSSSSSTYSHNNLSWVVATPTNQRHEWSVRKSPTFFATDDLLVVAFEQLRRDKCTLDVGHEAFSVGRTKPLLVLVVLDRWNGISYDDDNGDDLSRIFMIDQSLMIITEN